MSRLPTVAEVEQSQVWVSQKSSGVGIGPLLNWRNNGSLCEGRHYKRVKCRGMSWHGQAARPVFFYRRSRLKTLGKIDPRQLVTHHNKQLRKASERTTIDGVLHLRMGPAARYLGVTKEGLRAMAIEPEVIEVMGRPTSYYPLPTLKELKARRNGLHTCEPGKVNLKEATAITGRSTVSLRNRKWCIANNITQHKRTGLRRGNRPHVIYWFDEKELIAYVKNRGIRIPKGRMTATQAAEKLRVTRGTIHQLCREGILDAEWGDVPAGRWTRKKGYVISVASVRRVWKIIREHYPNRIRAGWALRAAKVETMQSASSVRKQGIFQQEVQTIRQIVIVDDFTPNALNMLGIGTVPTRMSGTNRAILETMRLADTMQEDVFVGRVWGNDGVSTSQLKTAISRFNNSESPPFQLSRENGLITKVR